MKQENFIWQKEAPAAEKRKGIETEIANRIQLELITLMMPVAISNLVEAGNTDLLDTWANKFFDTYVNDFNGLNEFCADKETDQEILIRFKLGTYTDDDMEVLSAYLTKNKPLFLDESEVTTFIQKNTH